MLQNVRQLDYSSALILGAWPVNIHTVRIIKPLTSQSFLLGQTAQLSYWHTDKEVLKIQPSCTATLIEFVYKVHDADAATFIAPTPRHTSCTHSFYTRAHLNFTFTPYLTFFFMPFYTRLLSSLRIRPQFADTPQGAPPFVYLEIQDENRIGTVLKTRFTIFEHRQMYFGGNSIRVNFSEPWSE